MEKNQTSCPKAVCEKIFRAITFGPAFSTIHRISSRQQTPAKHAPTPSLPNSDPPRRRPLDIKTKLTSQQLPKPKNTEGSEVPIKFDYTTSLPTPTEKPKPITALNGSTQTSTGQVQLDWMAQPKPSTEMVPGIGQQAQNKSKPKADKTNGPIQVKIERHQGYKEEAKKPTQYYDTFSAFIYQTRKRIMSHDDDDDQDYGENSPEVVGHGHGHGHGHGGIGKW